MVILDADSVMTGNCLSSLLRLMETNPNAGIIQTPPHAAGRDTLYARLQQFAGRVYGPLFVAGLHFWQLGESHYWGHNAIIRIAPFIRHCALGRLPGRGSLSGEILSHDFVEAALMRRYGWAVWIAYDLPGSFEEMPPNLVDELKRDRRWCHGNLMNFRLFLAPGFHLAHRAVFVTGVVAYVSAFLWFMFLLLSTWLLAQHTLVEPEYFTQPKQLFPLWPEWHPDRAIALFGVTATWLFLPKILSVALIAMQGAERFGGFVRLVLGMLAEWLFSMLLAPIRMLFHTQFVLAALSGWTIQWQSPPREDAATGWGTAVRRHGWHTLLGSMWAAGVYWLNPSVLWWLLPIVGALMLSIPISVYSSSARLGRLARKAGFFLIPEEANPPEELRRVAEELEYAGTPPDFAEAVADPSLNALTCALGVARSRPEVRSHFEFLLWSQGNLQQFLPHDIMIAAWGDFSLGLVYFDIVSAIPGIRTAQVHNTHLIPLLKRLFGYWNGHSRAPFELSMDQGIFKEGELECDKLDGNFRHMRSALVHAIKDVRGHHDCLYVLMSSSIKAPASARAMLETLLPYIDSSLRQLDHLPEQMPVPADDDEPADDDTGSLSGREL